MNLAQSLMMFTLRIYRALFSPVLAAIMGPLGLGCRFNPTCSAYALEAVRRHGAIQGFLLTLRRLCRCHPWGGCGEDPVPEQQPELRSSKFETDSDADSELRGRNLSLGAWPWPRS